MHYQILLNSKWSCQHLQISVLMLHSSRKEHTCFGPRLFSALKHICFFLLLCKIQSVKYLLVSVDNFILHVCDCLGSALITPLRYLSWACQLLFLTKCYNDVKGDRHKLSFTVLCKKQLSASCLMYSDIN